MGKHCLRRLQLNAVDGKNLCVFVRLAFRDMVHMGDPFFNVPYRQLVKRYPEPMAHGPEACEPSHPLWPMARRPVSRHTRAEAVDTGCQRDIPVL